MPSVSSAGGPNNLGESISFQFNSLSTTLSSGLLKNLCLCGVWTEPHVEGDDGNHMRLFTTYPLKLSGHDWQFDDSKKKIQFSITCSL